MASSDILTFAFGSFFLGLFLSVLLSMAQAGNLLLDYDQGLASYNDVMNQFSIKTQSAAASDLLENMVSSQQNPLAFDIILGIINVALYLFKIIQFLVIVLVNYFLLSVWLSQAGTPGAITGILVFIWQFWTLWHLAKFIFKGEGIGS